MGIEEEVKTEETKAVENMEDILGLNETQTSTENQNKNTAETENNSEPETKENTENNSESETNDKKEEEKPTTVTLTNEQVEINKELTLITSKIEEFEKESVDTDEFYSSLDEILTDDEKELANEDQPAYLKLIEKKKDEYIKERSKEDEIGSLKEKKEELEKIYDRQEGIKEVLSVYSDFDYEKAMDYYTNKLSIEQQQEIMNGCQTYADVYKKTYEHMTKKDPAKIKSEPAPDMPNLNTVRKEPASTTEVQSGMKTIDEELGDALGFGKK